MEPSSALALAKKLHILAHSLESLNDDGAVDQETLYALISIVDKAQALLSAQSKARVDETIYSHKNILTQESLNELLPEESPISTLYLANLSGGHPHMVANSETKINIVNDFFEGEGMVLMRVPEENIEDHPYYSVFEGKQRTIELQLQGVFKRIPRGGELFVGAEITERMKVGLLRKGMCNALLAFTRRVFRGIHYSFGDDSTGDLHELPHIVSPFISSCDRLVVTSGAAAPPLGELVPESDDARRARRAGEVTHIDGLYDGRTVTFSFNTMFIDLAEWQLCKLPMLKTMSLNEFWNKGDLQFVCYDRPSVSFHDLHPIADNAYAFKLRFYHVANGHAPMDFIAASRRRPRTASRLTRAASEVQAVETDDVGLMEDTADGTDDGDASDEDETGDGEEDEFQDCEGTDDDDDDPADDDDQATRNDGLFEIVRNSGSIIDKRAKLTRGDFPVEAGDGPAEETDGFKELDVMEGQPSLRGGSIVSRALAKLPLAKLPSANLASATLQNMRKICLPGRRLGESTVLSPLSSDDLSDEAEMRASPQRDPDERYTQEDDEADLSWRTQRFRCVGWADLGGRSGTHFLIASSTRLVPWSIKELAPLIQAEELAGRAATAASLIGGSFGAIDPSLISASEAVTVIGSSPSSIGPGSRLSLKEKQRRIIDRALRRFTSQETASESPFFDGATSAFLSPLPGANLRPYGMLKPVPTAVVRDGLVALALSDTHWVEAWYLLFPRLAVRHHVLDVHDLTSRNRLLRIAVKDITAVNCSLDGAILDEFLAGNVGVGGDHFKVGQCTSPLPDATGSLAAIEIETAGRVHVFIVRTIGGLAEASGVGSGGIQPWLLAIKAVVGPVLAAKWEWSEINRKANETLVTAAADVRNENRTCASPSTSRIGATDHGRLEDFLVACLPQDRALLVATAVSDTRHAFTVCGPERWKPTNRKVLNSRRMCFFVGEKEEGPWAEPHALVEDLLLSVLRRSGTFHEAAFEVDEDQRPAASPADDWSFDSFLDRITYLKRVRLDRLGGRRERLSFFINLYHLMVVHAHLVFGPPDNFLALAKLTSRACYEIGGDVLSIAELEHGVLRAAMCPPDQLGAKLLIPRGSPYPFRLTWAEPRLNFALVVGFRRGVCAVPVYTAPLVDIQLDDAVRRAFEAEGVGVRQQTVNLPKIVKWYRDDFGTPASLLDFVGSHLSADQKVLLDSLIKNVGARKVKLKFGDFNAACQELSLYRKEQ